MPLPLPLETLRTRLTEAWQRRAVSLKALSFATVGLINTAVDAGLFFLLQPFLKASPVIAEMTAWLIATTGYESMSALPTALANVGAWLVAVTGSYVMNSFTTFAPESGGKLRLKDYRRFLASGTAAVAASTLTVVVAMQFTPYFLTDEPRQLATAKACAILVSFAVNFSITHFVVFRARPEGAGERR